MTLRRPFERSLVAAVLVLALGAAANPVTAQQGFQTTEVAPGLYSFGNGFVYNAFMVTDDGVIVMDSINEEFATASLAAIREVTDKPIIYDIHDLESLRWQREPDQYELNAFGMSDGWVHVSDPCR